MGGEIIHFLNTLYKPVLMVNFNDTETAFAHLSNAELREAYWLFNLINKPFLVETGTVLTKWGLNLNLPIEPLIRRTIFKQFCGGESVEDSKQVIAKLAGFDLQTILDYGVEAKTTEAEFDRIATQLIQDIGLAEREDAVPAISSKITALARFALLEKVQQKEGLNEDEQAEWERVKKRVYHICEAAYRSNVAIYFDAEESWIQDTLDSLVIAMMTIFNKEKAIVYNTVQLYRHDRLDFLHASHHDATTKGYILAVKLVRGAYMEKERERATAQGYQSPIQESKEATDHDYNQALQYCLDHIENIVFCNATHNEQSCRLLCELMQQKGIPNMHPHIYFAQLYGMGNHISYNLSQKGYNVAKYLVYGKVKDVIPYLIRRAQENTSVTGQMSRELRLLQHEIKRRKLV